MDIRADLQEVDYCRWMMPVNDDSRQNGSETHQWLPQRPIWSRPSPTPFVNLRGGLLAATPFSGSSCLGVVRAEPSGRTVMQTLPYYCAAFAVASSTPSSIW